LPRALLGAVMSFFEAIGVTFDGDDLGIVDEAVDQRDDANTSRHSANGRLVVTSVLLL
jgi:hypothetical protein